MATGNKSPWCATLTLTTASTAYQLRALILASTNPPLTPPSPSPLIAEFLSIQVDPGAGGAKVFIGNSDVSATNRGYEIVAAQGINPLQFTSNLINLDQIYLMADTNATKVNVTFVTR